MIWSKSAAVVRRLGPRIPWATFGAVSLGVLATLVVLGAIAILHPSSFLGAHERASVESARGRFAGLADAYRERPLDLEGSEPIRALAQAIILAEDRAFYARPRFLAPLSVAGTARALIDNLFRGVRTGGSTIPIQLAKIALDEDERTLRGKLRELVLAKDLVWDYDPDTLLGLYLNLALSLGDRDPVHGAEQASLATRLRPLGTISREDALFLACLPKGRARLRSRPTLVLGRVMKLKAELETSGVWDRSRPSYLDDASSLDPAAEISLPPSWYAFVGAGAAEPDLAASLAEGQVALEATTAPFVTQGVGVSAGLVVVLGGPAFTTYPSSPEAELAFVSLASGAKLALLDVVVNRLGEAAAHALRVPTGGSIRWWWRRPKEGRRPGLISPNDVNPARLAERGPLSLVEAVALSVNSATMRYLVELLPYQLFADAPEATLAHMRLLVPEAETLATSEDRAIGSARLRMFGLDLASEGLPAELAAQPAGLYALRVVAETRRARGITIRRALPEDPTSILGNSSRETPASIANYLTRVFFEGPDRCALSPVGRALAPEFERGTASALAKSLPTDFGLTAWKTGTSPHDDSVWFGLALCIDARPAVLLGALWTVGRAKLPSGTYAGQVLAPALRGFIQSLLDRGHRVEGPMPPPSEHALGPAGRDEWVR